MLPPLKLECFRIPGIKFDLVPAQPNRQWMDAFPDRHPYRCLPLTIANTHGWDILCPATITFHWNGGTSVDDIIIEIADKKINDKQQHVVRSNFSRGIITFHTGFLFRTSPEWNLMATAPFNMPKKGVAPLTGIIESNWLPYVTNCCTRQ